MGYLERVILLQTVDSHWKEHLLNMDHLKEGIGLRGYGQKNPLNEYKLEGFEMFGRMIDIVKEKTLGALFRIQLVQEDEIDRQALARKQQQQEEAMQMRHGEGPAEQQPVRREGAKVGRNAPCPCGSGKKYKKCCGLAA